MTEWTATHLDQVVALKRGFDLPESTRTPGPYPVLGSAGISGWHSAGPVSGPGVTVGRSGASIGVATYYDGPYWPLNTTLFVEDFKGSDPRYIYYLLHGMDFDRYNSGSAQPSLNRNYISGIEVNLPPPAEQKAIGELLGALDDKIAVNDRTSGTAFKIAEGRYEVAVSRATLCLAVADVVDLKYGSALPSADRVTGNVPVYGSGGITGSHDKPLSPGPGIIVGRKGTVGSVYWSDQGFFAIDTTFYAALRRDVPMEFAFFMLRSLGLEAMNSDSAVPGLNRSNVLTLPVRVPDEKDLRTFHAAARRLFALRQALDAESSALAKLRDALLPRLMSGEIRVRDAEEMLEDAT